MISLNDVLLARANIPVDDPIAEIWGRGLQSGYKIIEYTGTLPITINANGDALIDYRIYGADGGAGEPTENLFDGEMEFGYYDTDGLKQNSFNWIRCKNFIKVNQNETYHAVIVNPAVVSGSVVFARCYNANKEYIGTATQSVVEYYKEYAFMTLPDTEYVTFYISIAYNGLKIALFETTASKPYVPYGYKLPMTVGDGNTTQSVPVYIGSDLLSEDEYVDYAEGKIYRKNPANYFDGYFELGALDYITGAETKSNTSIRTDFIELEPSNKYYIKWAAGSLYILMISYDENKNYVKYLGAKSANPSYFNIDANEKYIRFYLYNTTTPPKEMMVCKNADAPYYAPQDPPVPLPEIPTIDGTTIIDYDGDPKPSQMYIKYKVEG